MTGAAPKGGRTRIVGTATAVAALLGAGLVTTSAAEPGARAGGAAPNVVVIMTDDQRFADLRKAMPRTVGRIGNRGAEFTQSFATFPLCCPSRATYLTGQYAHNHGVQDNHPPEGGMEVFDDSDTIATALDDAGYYTGWVGKYLNGYLPFARQDPPYVPPGWDWWRAAAQPRTMYNWQQVIQDHIQLWGSGRPDYQTDVYARQAVRFIGDRGADGEPFFLTVAPFAPHVETRSVESSHNPRGARRHRALFADERFPKPPAYNEADVSDKPSFIQELPSLGNVGRIEVRDRYRDRLNSLVAVDELVAGVLRALRENGLMESTLVIFTSDNGIFLGEHRLRRKNRIYDAASRVPLLVRGPGVPVRKVRSPVGNVDLAATVYDYTGVPPAATQDGISLLDTAAAPGAHADRELLIEVTRGVALRTLDWFYAEHETKLGTEVELYDLEADPGLLNSAHLDPRYTTRRGILADRLDDLRDCSGAGCR